MKIIPKRAKNFIYREYRITINAEYDSLTDFGVWFKGKFLEEGVFLTYEVRDPNNGLFAIIDRETIRKEDRASLVATYQKKRNNNKIKNKYDLIHISEVYEEKLQDLIISLKNKIDYCIDGTAELNNNQKITDGIPGSLKGLEPK